MDELKGSTALIMVTIGLLGGYIVVIDLVFDPGVFSS